MRRATLRWLVLCAVIPLVAGCGKTRPSGEGVVLTQAARCAECHGDPARESSAATDPLIAAAPPAVPYADRDRAAEIVGAHDRHLRSGPISPAFPCRTCHVLPEGYSHQHQAQGKVTFSGRATVSEWPGTAVFQAPTAPVWNGATAGGARTCSAVYCHGNFPNGAGAVEVAWTGGTVSCGSCHGIPPPPPHPAVAADPSGCATCHPDPATSGLHVDGQLELVGAGHDASWMDVTSPGFHAAEAITGLDACARCHGPTLAGGVVVPGCGACHDQNLPAGVATWSKNCTMCHGGVEDATGAPPKATWGHGGDPVRTGAHHAHVAAVDGLAPPIACTTCHPSHQDALEPGHVAGTTAVVTFDTLATPPGGPAPVWDRQAATCSATYCHGATLAGGSDTAPVWTTLDGSQAACGTCHGIPPPAPHPAVASDPTVCIACHPATVDAAGAIIPPSSGGKHLDGIVEAQGHGADWMDTTSTGFHAYAADRGLALCESCHGQDLSGGPANVACATCHDQNLPAGVASWKTNCTMCHGGTNDQTGAPPRTTWGQSADPVRTGAHALHLAKGMACGSCHVVPADALAAGHVDAPTATVTFAGLAVTGGVQPSWNRTSATCASTYCHGNFRNGNASYTPNWTAPAANDCGTCHGLPPGGTHPSNPNCGNCHDGYTATSVNPALHLNGSVDLYGLTCSSCHGDSTRQPTALNPQLAAAPPMDTLGNTSSPAVGAHLLHLQADVRPIACTECHVVPTSVTHSNGIDDVVFGALATANGTLSPVWDPAGLTCSSTYCHGNFVGGNASNTPSWASPRASSCGTCHATPPPDPHPAVDVSGGLGACNACHVSTVDPTGALIPASAGGLHLDGTVEAVGHSPSWMDQTSTGFHAYSAEQGLTPCKSCHGATLDGAPGVYGCGDCHGAGWSTNCTMCHGGVVDTTGAPPKTTWGNGGDAVRIGAHHSHVAAANNVSRPIACTTCHPGHQSALDPGHIAGTTAVLTFDALATPPGAPSPVWDRTTATCSATYCHGATLVGGSVTKPTWTTTDGSQEACGSCHGLPPNTGRHLQHVSSYGIPCQACHQRVLPYQYDPTLHVNGQPNLDPSPTANAFGGFANWNAAATGPGTLVGTSTGCHGGIYYWKGNPASGFGCY